MRKKSAWTEPHEYKINGVKYIVESCFLTSKINDNASLSDRLERIITSDITPLTNSDDGAILSEEYVCSVAGKED